MYTKRIQLHNYGPIDRLDIDFPFEGDVPKPVVLVGENGSGKSIVLSHIVNGLMSVQSIAYPETPEVAIGKVYKLRGNSYIKSGGDYYFGRVDFEDGLFIKEMNIRRAKREAPAFIKWVIEGDAKDVWDSMGDTENDHYSTNISEDSAGIKEVFAKNCVLYFPPNRFEEPAWLNQENLNAKAQYMDMKHLQGYTNRKVINYSPLHDNQNWLFEVIYDRAAFETRNFDFPIPVSSAPFQLPVFTGYSGNATSTYEVALQIVRSVTAKPDARFGVGWRHNRVVSIESDSGQIVPNIFQLSSGETALLNLFLTILRDFDMTGTLFANASDIRGIVVVDEIDLHLHAIHQHEILPALIRMFPKVQFVVTTHSPLFVLGMNKVFGEDGFAVYRLPEGRQISPEEFSEFGDAYQIFTDTTKYSRDIQAKIQSARKPIVIPEGKTDRKYICKAAKHLGKEDLLNRIDIWDGDGAPILNMAWKALKPLSANLDSLKIMLLFDCDTREKNDDVGNLSKRVIPLQDDNPVKKGIENLFSEGILKRARQHKTALVDINRPRIERGKPATSSDEWTVHHSEKMNLCNWLCENGSQDDFQGFAVIFDLLEELLEEDSA